VKHGRHLFRVASDDAQHGIDHDTVGHDVNMLAGAAAAPASRVSLGEFNTMKLGPKRQLQTQGVSNAKGDARTACEHIQNGMLRQQPDNVKVTHLSMLFYKGVYVHCRTAEAMIQHARACQRDSCRRVKDCRTNSLKLRVRACSV